MHKADQKPHVKTKAADLERIRNNQRRSRTRRKDYVTELEEKIRRYESTGNQTFANPKVQQLVEENEMLKRLLHSMGLGTDFVKAYTRASEVASEISQTAVQPDSKGCCQDEGCSSSDNMQANSMLSAALELPPPSLFLEADYKLDAEVPTQSRFEFWQDQLQAEDFLPWASPLGFSNLRHDSSRTMLGHSESDDYQIDIHSAGDVPVAEASNNSMPLENTTLCSLAFSLIMTNNRKGYSAVDLELRLRAGYRRGTVTSEACRVENKILFSLLAEIL